MRKHQVKQSIGRRRQFFSVGTQDWRSKWQYREWWEQGLWRIVKSAWEILLNLDILGKKLQRELWDGRRNLFQKWVGKS